MIGQAAVATNLDGDVNYWNKAAETIYGWKREEAIGKNIMQLTTPEVNKEQAKQIMEGLKSGQTWSGEFKVQKKDGTNFPTLVTNAPIYDENNRLSGIIGISSDITQEVKNKELLKQYTRELERSNEELEQFAFIASHDLQEPLRMISSFMDQLTRKYGDQLDEKAHQYIHFATDGAKRMKQIILDLLEYSRATNPTEGKEKVDLNEVFSEFKLLRQKLISEKSAEIKSTALPTLHTHKAAITQILHCLLDNALKYSEAGTLPIVELKAVENEKEWEFSIKDNGIGIDPEFYDKIFIIFQRLHNRDKYTGTGIGLSIAKRHVEFLGGNIWLKSAVGKDTIFYFTIPKNK
jgi:PAS domain S-box-containing protein